MKKEKKPDKGKTQLLIWGVPKKLKAEFKAACASKRTSMKHAVLGFMRATIHDHQSKTC